MNLKLLHELNLPTIDVKLGEVLLRQGERSSSVYILLSGGVAVTIGDHLLAREISPGTVLGEISALLGTTITATVTAVEPSRLYRIEQFTTFLREHPDLSVHVAQTLAYRLVYMNEHFVEVRDQIDILQKKLVNYLPVFARESMLNFQQDK